MEEVIIKNMVCPRCIAAVRQIFQGLNVNIETIKLGSVKTSTKITADERRQLRERLTEQGFELLDDKQAQLINEIKSIIIQEVHYQKEPVPINISTLLSKKLKYDYAYMSRLFSAVESRTIEKFVLTQKIERVKELLTYGEWTLSEIAFQMHYSSSAHLSAQFKKITGMSPTAFKQLQSQDRSFLDQV